MCRKLVEEVRKRHPEAKAKVYTVEHNAAYNTAVKAGEALIWDLSTRQTPFEMIRLAVRGWWPKDVDDPNSPLIEPTKEDLDEYKIRIYEGLSTYCAFMGGNAASGGLAARAGRGERIGPAEETVKFMDGGTSVGGNARSHYNVIQREAHAIVSKSHGLSTYNIWTAHEIKAKDDMTGMPIVGPEVFGKAATQDVPRWFANVIHLSLNPVTKKIAGVDTLVPEYYMWLKPHYDPQASGVPFIAKNSIDIELQGEVPLFLKGGASATAEFITLMEKHGQFS